MANIYIPDTSLHTDWRLRYVLVPCRQCGHQVHIDAVSCPGCGAPSKSLLPPLPYKECSDCTYTIQIIPDEDAYGGASTQATIALCEQCAEAEVRRQEKAKIAAQRDREREVERAANAERARAKREAEERREAALARKAALRSKHPAELIFEVTVTLTVVGGWLYIAYEFIDPGIQRKIDSAYWLFIPWWVLRIGVWLISLAGGLPLLGVMAIEAISWAKARIRSDT